MVGILAGTLEHSDKGTIGKDLIGEQMILLQVSRQ